LGLLDGGGSDHRRNRFSVTRLRGHHTMLMHAAINNTAGIVASPASGANPFS
jgi:hypothetical protein